MTAAADPLENLKILVRCPSVTPAEGGALAALQAMLEPLGFRVERPVFSEGGTPDVENLYGRLGTQGPHLMFAGHTDVVPIGDAGAWTHPPFAAEIANGMLYGRGTVDMKGGIACFVAAIARHIAGGRKLNGSLSMLITGDEEGPSINGTPKLLAWAAERGERWDAALVGEPTNPDALGDMIKVGRRGSLSGVLTVQGRQGHAAYPHLADNPVRGLLALAESLLSPLDEGTTNFQPSNLEITSVDVGNSATNVIPAKAKAAFNIRFNDLWTPETLAAEIHNRLDRAARRGKYRAGRSEAVDFDLQWRDRPSDVFLTHNEKLIAALGGSVEAVTGRRPALSTTGGTSDARYIKDYCPVVEFGLVGQTMHMVDERVAVEDLETLTAIYQRFVGDWFG